MLTEHVTMSRAREDQLWEIARRVGTPVYVYDADVVRGQMATLRPSFERIRFAQKACPNIHIQRLLRSEGALVDCVSLGELERAFAAGFKPGQDPPEIVYTSDILTESAIARIVDAAVPVNAGSEDMLTQIGQRSRGHQVWLRLNPGFGHGHSQKVNTGGESSKHGIWHENLADALRRVDEFDLDLVGLHMHIGSGADLRHQQRVCDAMVTQVERLGRDLRAISAGGGLSIPYRPGDPGVDVATYFRCWDGARKRIEGHLGHAIDLEIEPGRYLVGAAGVLVAEVRASKTVGANRFVLVDAGFNDLVRPAMYGAYHHISILHRVRESTPRPTAPTLVAGPLCESGDVFTQGEGAAVTPRDLPYADVGDLLVVHDTGAYGAAMASNYNSRPLAPEILIDGEEIEIIRRRQTIAELLALEGP
jgi:diaminopimelate decarboxylase